MPAEMVAGMREAPFWQGMEAVAHTLPYDGRAVAAAMSGSPEPLRRWASVQEPVLVMDGDQSPPYQGNAVQALVEILPRAGRRTFAGQSHDVTPEVPVPALKEFFAG